MHVSSFISKGIDLWNNMNEEIFEDVYEKIEFKFLVTLINELLFISSNLKKRIF